MAEKKEIGLDTVVVRTVGLVAADLDGEKVMLDIEKGKYFGLNNVGGQVWELLAQPHTVREILAALQEEYLVEEQECLADIQAFLSELYTRELIKID